MNPLNGVIKTLGKGTGNAISFAGSSAMSGASTVAAGFQSIDPVLSKALTMGLSGLSKSFAGLLNIKDTIKENSLKDTDLNDLEEISAETSNRVSELDKTSESQGSELIKINEAQLERLSTIEESLKGDPHQEFDAIENKREGNHPYISKEQQTSTHGKQKKGVFKALGNMMPDNLMTSLHGIKVAILGTILAILNPFKIFGKMFKSIFMFLIGGKVKIALAILAGVIGWINREAIAENWEKAKNALGEWWESKEELIERIKTKSTEIWDELLNKISNFGAKARDKFDYIFGLGDYGEEGKKDSMMTEAKKGIKDTFEAITDGVKDAFLGHNTLDASKNQIISGQSVSKRKSRSNVSRNADNLDISRKLSFGPNATRDEIISKTIEFEGGSKMNIDDGGLTKFGIASKYNPGVDVANLSEQGARDIYVQKYWNPMRADEMPKAVAMEAFDFAVQHGVAGASKRINAAFGLTGNKITDATLAAINSAGEYEARQIINFARKEKLKSSKLGRTNPRGAFGRYNKISNASEKMLGEDSKISYIRPKSEEKQSVDELENLNSTPKKEHGNNINISDNSTKINNQSTSSRSSSRPASTARTTNTFQHALNQDFAAGVA